MDNFLRYFFQDIGNIFRALFDVFGAIGDFLIYLLDFRARKDKIVAAYPDFNTLDWILLILVNLILLVLIVVGVVALVRLCKKLIRFKVSPKQVEEMQKQIRQLQRDLIRANYEKDRLMALRMAEISGDKAVLEGFKALDEPEPAKERKARPPRERSPRPMRSTKTATALTVHAWIPPRAVSSV